MTPEEQLQHAKWTLQKRKIKEDGFKAYCRHFGPRLCPGYDFQMAPHHLLMAQELETAMHTYQYNVMFLMPPGHAKSTYSSILFPSYFLAENPGFPILACENTVDLAEHFGRETRSIIMDPFYQFYAGATLSKDSHAASRFRLTNGSSYTGAGVGKAITGKRARLGLIDDPTRGHEAAHSEVQREEVWRWWLFDFLTRLLPGASKIMAVTRWHEDDLPGRILNSPQGKYWKVISLPAIAEEHDALGRKPGEALWPQVYPLEVLLQKKDEYKNDIKAWESLYQQHPTVETGDYFKKEWIQYINKVPTGLNYYGASDYAVTAGRGDYTVHVVIGHDEVYNDIYIVDLWREQTTTEIWVDAFLKLAQQYKTLVWAEESGQIIKSLDPYISKEMRDKNKFVFREQFTCAVNKTIRARAFQGYMAQGKVFILNTTWTASLVRELLSFPDGKNDDQVDALGLIGRLLEEMVLKLEKQKKKEEYEYKSGKIILPGLDEKLTQDDRGAFKKI